MAPAARGGAEPAGELLAEMSRRYLVDGRTLEFVDPQELLVGAPDVARVL